MQEPNAEHGTCAFLHKHRFLLHPDWQPQRINLWHDCSAVGRVAQTGIQDFLTSLCHPQLDGLLGLGQEVQMILDICNIHDHPRARQRIRIRQCAAT
ncbi:hypothetical protein PoB_000732000 [Plakobranchus ocellatus]|uniref:Uncharacterized protein n=1 Tax=Plakobranchus ocellatus TaxID=259542 RepID=A0AAV3YE72_9GAST|nr:hypothetical protein PoB_000732000 [Plakobranchus ocellatus]